MRLIRAFGRALASVRLFIVLAALAGLLGIAGSIIPQGLDAGAYLGRYEPRVAVALIRLGLTDVFRSPLFLAIAVLAEINLLACTLPRAVRRFHGVRRLRAARGIPDPRPAGETHPGAAARTSARLLGFAPDVIHLGLAILIAAGLVGILTREQELFIVEAGSTVEFRHLAITAADSRRLVDESPGLGEVVVGWEIDLAIRERDDRRTAAPESREESGGAVTRTVALNRPVTHDGVRLHFQHWSREELVVLRDDADGREVLRRGEGFRLGDDALLVFDDRSDGRFVFAELAPDGTRRRDLAFEVGSRIGPFEIVGGETLVQNGFQATWDPSRPLTIAGLLILSTGMAAFVVRQVIRTAEDDAAPHRRTGVTG